jgi:DNA-binding NarL/FixJ family response regulator
MPLSRSIVVVENEALLRDLIAQSLETSGFVVTTAANVADAKRAISAVDPDACVVDIELGPGPNGFDLAEYLQRQSPDVGVVFLTNLPDPRFAERDLSEISQNQAYLRKSQLVDSRELVSAITAVLKEENVSKFRHDKSEQRPLANLSKRQLAVLRLISNGNTNSQIAELRGTSVRAVEGMVSRLFQVLGIDSTAEGNPRVEAAKKYLTAVGKASDEE